MLTVKLAYLSVFLLLAVHDGGTAHLGDLLVVAIERPAADLARAKHVLEE